MYKKKQQVGIPVQFSSKTKAPTKRYNLRSRPYQRIDHSLCKYNNDKESLTNESTSKNNIMEGVEGEPDVGSKRHSLQAVELSQRTQAAVQIVSNLPAPSNGGPIYRFLGKPAMRTRWMAGAVAHKRRVMSRPIQVRQLKTRKSGFVISAINKYMSESRYP